MAIYSPHDTASMPGDVPLTLDSAADLLMTGALEHVRKLQTVVRSSGVLAVEAEMGAEGFRHRIRFSEAPGDRIASLTCMALRLATNQALTDVRTQFTQQREDERRLIQASKHVLSNGTKGIKSDMSSLYHVIRPVFKREHSVSPTPLEHGAIATNSFGIMKRVAGRNRYITVPLMDYLRLYPGMIESAYDPAKFTLAETDSGLALAFADPESVREVTLQALSKAADTKKYTKTIDRPQCPAMNISDAEGNLVEANWQLMNEVFIANAEVNTAGRFRRDMVLATHWAVGKLRA